VASSTLNVFGNNCQEVLAAETLMMVKERFVENYGEAFLHMAWGWLGRIGAEPAHQRRLSGCWTVSCLGCSFQPRSPRP